MSQPAVDSMRASCLALLRGQRAGVIPLVADITYWITGREQDGTADPAWNGEEGYLALHRDLGIMPYYYYPKFSVGYPAYDAAIEWTHQRQGQTTTQTIRTPRGELTEVSVFLPESCSTGIVKHFVETPEELDILRYLLEHRRLVPCNLDDYTARLAAWTEYDGLPSLGFPRSPLSSFFYEWAGVLQGVYLLLDCESAALEAMAMMEAQEAPLLAAVCELRPPLIHFADNLSSDNITPFYDDLMAPMHRRWLEQLHQVGITAAVHLDGTIRGLLPKLAAVGFDSVEALTPKPVGDVGLAEMRAVAGSDRLVLWGGLPGAMFAPPYRWEDMEAHLHQLLDAWRGTPFIIGVADQVPPDGDITFLPKIAAILRDIPHQAANA